MHERRFFRLKHRTTEKLLSLLQAARNELARVCAETTFHLPSGTDCSYGKISRGENYRGYPYLLLDFPRLFSHEQIFAFRTMIWWGHYCSFALVLKGPVKDKAQRRLLNEAQKSWTATDYLCIHTDPWQHDFSPDNVRRIRQYPLPAMKRLLQQRDFLKLMRRWPLKQVDHLPHAAAQTWQGYARNLLSEHP